MKIDGCKELIKRLEKVEKDLSQPDRRGKLHDYMRDTWQVGYDELKTSYDMATTKEGDKANENTTIVSSPKFSGDSMELTAMGSDIMFLEFGTGLQMDYENPYASKFGFYPSSYSGGPGKGFLVPPKLNHFHGAWPHGGKLHWGQNPARGMYHAFKAMDLYVRSTPLRIF